MEQTTTTDYRDRPVGELVAEDYRRASVFTRFGIDFCCGGGKNVADACERAGADYGDLEAALQAVDRTRGANGDDARDWELDRLVSHIELVHHRYVREQLPVLKQWTTKVARVHGSRHEELLEVRDGVHELAEEMEAHMAAEEEVLFPRVVAIVRGQKEAAGAVGSETIESLEDDHDRAGALMKRLRDLTAGFQPPEDACATYRAAFALLAEFEQDLHRHVHLENNILFPRAAALARG